MTLYSDHDTWYTAHMCLRRALLPHEVALRVRDFVDPQLAVRCGKQLVYRDYNSLIHPLEEQMDTMKQTLHSLYKKRMRTLKHIEQTCTHPQRRRLCESGCYGDRYWQCPDCHKEW
jgi:hypothetical protein